MGLSNYGADRILNAIIGTSVPVISAANIRGKLHTASSPTAGNELSGSGYSDDQLAVGDFTKTTASGRRVLSFPAMSFFTDAGGSAQTAQSVALWHGTSLAWHVEDEVVPNNAAVAAAAGAVNLEIPLANTSITFTAAALDRGFDGLSGLGVAAADMYWVLHNTSGVPSAANQLSGGGIDAVMDAAWTLSTVSGYRRATQGAITFTNALTADTNAEPNVMALWRGDPDSSGVLHAYWDISPSGMTQSGASITIAANQVYIELNLAGS